MVHPLIVIGSDGFIGKSFCKAFPNALAIGKKDLDLLSPEIHFSTEGRRYALIAAGMGNPKKCEENPRISYQCNVEGTLRLGKELSKKGIFPIFCSTDYVFNDDLEILPLNTYGMQKAELEVKALEMDALVIRLSKVYGTEKGDGTLFDEMAATLSQKKMITAARDQIFSPVFIGDVIQATSKLIQENARGIANITGPCFDSRFEMAKLVAEGLSVSVDLIQEISLDELKDGVKRPKRLRLTSSSGISWKEGIARVVKGYAA